MWSNLVISEHQLARPEVCASAHSDLNPPEAGEVIRHTAVIGRELGDVATDWLVLIVFIL